jgi:hypothetical protein
MDFPNLQMSLDILMMRSQTLEHTARKLFAPKIFFVAASHMGVRPYVASRIYSLDVGSPAIRFLVHSEILERSSIPPSVVTFSANVSQPIALPELDEATAHTLVHYLYSSSFQGPSLHGVDKATAHHRSYKHATCVYCAAVRYSISGLDQLAKQKIIHHGVGLSIFDILAVARDHGFPLLPDSDTQYSKYLESCITQAMKEDPEPFRKPDFITKFGGNSRLLQVIWETVMSNYAATPAPPNIKPATESSAETPTAESLLTENDASTQDILNQLPSPTESVVDSPSIPREADDLKEPVTLSLNSFAPEDAKASAETSSNGTDQSTHFNAALNDDFGLSAIDPTIEQADVPETITALAEDVKEPGHVRADSVVEEDVVAPADSFDDAKHGASSGTAAVVSNGHHDTGKKNKKKGKKRHSAIVF